MPSSYLGYNHEDRRFNEISNLPDNFRVSIFGSARTKKDDPLYSEVFELAKKIGEAKLDVITGGGPGVMEAGNAGHMAGDVENNATSIGLNIKLPFEQHDNPYLEKMAMFDHFSSRLDTFMELSNCVVVMRGGIGTCLELFYSWQLTQVNHVRSMPIILVGKMWKELIVWIKDYVVANNLCSIEDLDHIYVVENTDEAMAIINAAYDVYKKEGEEYHLNYKKHDLSDDQYKGANL